MTTQSITLNIPDSVFQNLKLRADQASRTIEEETLEVLAGAMSSCQLPDELEQSLAALKLLDEAALWKTARMRLPCEVSVEMEGMHHKQQRERLTAAETTRLAELVRQYERHMLMRSQAIALLKQQGHDVSELIES